MKNTNKLQPEIKARVYARLPGTGLGNLLLIWARAKVFSHRNGLPLVTSRWWGFRPGAWLRNEKQKRLYWGYFRETPWMKKVDLMIREQFSRVINEPDLDQVVLPGQSVIYRFAEPISRNELFGSIQPYRDFIREELYKLLQPKMARLAKALPAPEIAIHVRRGDFKFASTVTPDSFFIDCIQLVRREIGHQIKVTIFTDAESAEISSILQLENVELAKKKPDILDILEMSRGRVLILSQTSTFSYWAAFLSDGIVIKPHGDWYGDIRPADVNANSFEGAIGFDLPETLLPLKQALNKALTTGMPATQQVSGQ